jgi:hypothetical protein
MAFKARVNAPGMPQAGDTIRVYEVGTTTLVTGLLAPDTGGAPLSNPITIPSSGFWGFEPPAGMRVDVHWVEGGRNLIEDVDAHGLLRHQGFYDHTPLLTIASDQPLAHLGIYLGTSEPENLVSVLEWLNTRSGYWSWVDYSSQAGAVLLGVGATSGTSTLLGAGGAALGAGALAGVGATTGVGSFEGLATGATGQGVLVSVSAATGVTTISAWSLLAPTGHSVDAGDTEVTLHPGTSTGATGYKYYMTTDGTTPTKTNYSQTGTATNNQVLTGLTNDVLHKFVFTATYGSSESPESTMVSTTPEAVGEPQNTTILSSTATNTYGTIMRTNSHPGTWSALRDAATGTGTSLVGFFNVSVGIADDYDDYWSTITRGHFQFDLGSLAGKTVTAVNLLVYKPTGGHSLSPKWCVQESTLSGTLSTSHYTAFTGGSLGESPTITITAGWVTIPLNTDGVALFNAAIAGSGVAKLCFRNYDRDFLNVALSAGQQIYGEWTSPQNSNANRPKVDITYY